jgi:hypothetical protein
MMLPGCEIILDFVTDNKYYFTGNIVSRGDVEVQCMILFCHGATCR